MRHRHTEDRYELLCTAARGSVFYCAMSVSGRVIPAVAEAVARGPQVKLPSYPALDPNDAFTGRMIGTPARKDIPFIVNEAAVIEFYAR